MSLCRRSEGRFTHAFGSVFLRGDHFLFLFLSDVLSSAHDLVYLLGLLLQVPPRDSFHFSAVGIQQNPADETETINRGKARLHTLSTEAKSATELHVEGLPVACGGT